MPERQPHTPLELLATNPVYSGSDPHAEMERLYPERTAVEPGEPAEHSATPPQVDRPEVVAAEEVTESDLRSEGSIHNGETLEAEGWEEGDDNVYRQPSPRPQGAGNR